MEKEKTVTFSLPLRVVEKLDRMAREKNTTKDDLLTAALEQYFKSGSIWEQIYKWGEEAAHELGIRTEEDVDRLVHE